MLPQFAKVLSRIMRRDVLPKRQTPPHLQAVALEYSSPLRYQESKAPATIYQQSPWVYVAVNRIAEAGALVPLRVLRVEGEQTVEVVRHPLEVLLDAPNPYLSRFELFEQTLGMLELFGNAYWFLAGDETGAPSQIWTLRPDQMTIVPDVAHYIRGYIYEINGRRIPFEPQEIVHFKRWHPANDYYGLSALEAARLAVSSDRAMAQWNHNTFGQDHGVPAGVVSVKDKISDADYDRLKREWRSTYGAGQRRTAFLRGTEVEWHNIGLSHTELDFLQGRRAHRDEILNIFGVPVGLVSDNATEANATVAERMFIERTLYPKLVRIAQKITQEILPFWGEDAIVQFDDIRPTDMQARLDEIKTAYSVLSINEIRARYYDLPPVNWGILPVGMNPDPADRDSTKQNADVGAHGGAASESDNAASTKSALDELIQWERFALKRLGRASGRPFAVRALPDELAFEIAAGVMASQTEDDLRAVFTTARTTLELNPASPE